MAARQPRCEALGGDGDALFPPPWPLLVPLFREGDERGRVRVTWRVRQSRTDGDRILGRGRAHFTRPPSSWMMVVREEGEAKAGRGLKDARRWTRPRQAELGGHRAIYSSDSRPRAGSSERPGGEQGPEPLPYKALNTAKQSAIGS